MGSASNPRDIKEGNCQYIRFNFLGQVRETQCERYCVQGIKCEVQNMSYTVLLVI